MTYKDSILEHSKVSQSFAWLARLQCGKCLRREAAWLKPFLLDLQVLREVYEGPFFYREGGSIPALALMKEHLGIWCTSFGFGLATDNLHSPNERCVLVGIFPPDSSC